LTTNCYKISASHFPEIDPVRHWNVFASAALAALAFLAANACAQSLEPRSFTNSPVGLNFLIAGFGYQEGTIAFDPSLPVSDAQFHSTTEVVGYVRTFGVWGNSAKFDVIVPYTSLAGDGLLAGKPKSRVVSGYNDPLFRVSMNFYGAPALSMKEFAGYRQDLIIGASLQVSAPLGQYDNTKLINIGNNRWSFKPQLGISKAWDAWSVEIAPGATFYTDNTDFNFGGTFAQDPVYSVQAHVTRSLQSGAWISLNSTYFTGGRTTVNGVRGATLQTNSRLGVTVALPIDRNNSVKLYGSAGTFTRTGADFNGIGIAWQYRWGGGF
jgi:hypothetical protein